MMKLSHFRFDITPPIGHPLCAGWYPKAEGISEPLTANGIILFPENDLPVVLCALDWCELSNDEYDLWLQRLAAGAGTTPERVTVHCIHAHDSPWPDRGAQNILDEAGNHNVIMWRDWNDNVLANAENAARQAVPSAQAVTAVRSGKAKVHQVASNRRVKDENGNIHVRWTRCRDAAVRAAPEGIIDPYLKTISFWNCGQKLVALHYYAVHPTSYDGTGRISTDFVGIARERMAAQEGIPHIYFTECAGNITAGKYNDGVADNRELFTQRIFDAMVEAQNNSREFHPGEIQWKIHPIILPARETEKQLQDLINGENVIDKVKSRAAISLRFQQRGNSGIPINISALHLGNDIISVHLPGESFIEYQLYAQELSPKATVVVPSYADCGPGYIPLAASFAEGGYEPTDAFCNEECEEIMREAIKKVVE